jgi:hypothetical protein
MNSSFGSWGSFGTTLTDAEQDAWEAAGGGAWDPYAKDSPSIVVDKTEKEKKATFDLDLAKAGAIWDTFGPKLISLVGDLTAKRKNSLAGLYRQKATLEKKIAKARTKYLRDSLVSQLAHIEKQIALLQGAIQTGAPKGEIDDLTAPKGSPWPWVFGGLALFGVMGGLAYVLTREKGKNNA